jgi:regulator of replication initiation timing
MKKTLLTFLIIIISKNLFAQINTCHDIEFPTVNSSLYQGVYYNNLQWENGSTLRISFINGDDYVQSEVKKMALEWSQFANIRFQFISDPGSADIRISFYTGKGSWSLIGKQSDDFSVDVNSGKNIIGRGGTSMNFGWFFDNTDELEFKRTTLHEFGHALGLLHEHLNPLGGIKWNLPKVYAYYMQVNHWTKEEVDFNVLNRYAVTQTNGEYDPASIMHYPIPRDLTLDGFEVGLNTDLSEKDKQLIAKLYPSNIIIPSYTYTTKITNLSYGDGVWSLVMSKMSSNFYQEWMTRNYFPSNEIQKSYDSSCYISNVTYGDGLWAVVMSKGSNFTAQQWRTRNYFPKDEIQELYDQNYYITNLAYGHGLWAVVMSKENNYTAQQQWRTRNYFPSDEIQKLYDQNYYITNLTYGHGLWAVVMSKDNNYTAQQWITRNYFPKDEINEFWKQGYQITQLTYGGGY